MIILDLLPRTDILESQKLSAAFIQFGRLINLLKERVFPISTIELINHEINEINATNKKEQDFIKLIKNSQSKILKHLEKEFKIIPKHQNLNLGTALGISSIGIPIGVAFGIAIKNMSMLGLGLPIGLAIGALIGRILDNKAAKEGRQLDIVIKP